MMTTKKRILLYTIPLVLLSIPFVAGFFTKEVNWSVNDFIIAGVLLFTTAFTVDFILSKVKMRGRQFLYISLILIALFLIWAELAVGIFGSPFAGN